jgi:hypothetical protein
MGNEKALEGALGSLFKSFSPADESAMLGPFRALVETMTNYDLFRDKPIVPAYEADKPLELRKGIDHASRTGQILQDVLQVDARKIDHIIKAQTGNLGDLGLWASDLGREDRPGGMGVAIGKLSGIVRQSPAWGAKEVTEAQKLMRQASLQGSREAKRFSSMVDAYFAAKTDAEKDKKAQVLRKEARRLIPIFENKLRRKIDIGRKP